MLSSEINDKAVYSKNMVELGKAKDLEYDSTEMKVTHLIVQFERGGKRAAWEDYCDSPRYG